MGPPFFISAFVLQQRGAWSADAEAHRAPAGSVSLAQVAACALATARAGLNGGFRTMIGRGGRSVDGGRQLHLYIEPPLQVVELTGLIVPE